MADFSKGWITLLRSIQDHKFWQEKPFDKARAWIDLILTANHTNGKMLMGNQIIEIERSQILTSQLKLSKRWGWSREKVKNFLTLLERDFMVTLKTSIQKSKGYTLITLINYNELQSYPKHKPTTKKASNRQLTDNKPTTNQTLTKNVKNDKEDIYTPIEYLNQKTKSHFDPKNKSNQDLVKARYNEGRTLEDFKRVIDTKVAQWLNDEKMMKYLRPSTLFNRTNFENYLNEPSKIKPESKKHPETCQCKGTGFIYDERGNFKGKCDKEV